MMKVQAFEVFIISSNTYDKYLLTDEDCDESSRLGNFLFPQMCTVPVTDE